MRSLALLLVLIAAFYVLFSEQRPGSKGRGKMSGENKPSEVKNENEGEEPYFAQGIPEDFMPSDVSKFGTMEKLKDDLDYRRMKMDHQLDAEMKEFKDTHDKNGKDKEAYEALIKQHKEVRDQFSAKYVEQVKAYKRMKAELYETNDKGLR